MSKARRHSPPTDLRMGWVDTDVKRDAVELAKGDALKHLRAHENSWYAVMPFLGGHLWEIQENGSGHSYLPAVVEALAKGVEPAWFQVNNRAYTVAVRDGKPQCLIQNVAQSKLLIDGDKPRLKPRGRMLPVVRKGTGIFAFGATVFGTGFLFLVSCGIGYVTLEHMVPDSRVLDVDNLPYRQWPKVQRTADGLYVEALRFQNNQWTTAVKPVVRTALDDSASPDGQGRQSQPRPTPVNNVSSIPARPVPPLPPVPGPAPAPQQPAPIAPRTLPMPPQAPVPVAGTPAPVPSTVQGAQRPTSAFPTMPPSPVPGPQPVPTGIGAVPHPVNPTPVPVASPQPVPMPHAAGPSNPVPAVATPPTPVPPPASFPAPIPGPRAVAPPAAPVPPAAAQAPSRPASPTSPVPVPTPPKPVVPAPVQAAPAQPHG